MFVSIATTHRPATDLGFLLMKHPERVHEVDLNFGKGVLLYPEANEDRCEAVLMIDVDPVGLVRGRGMSEGMLDQYVNDRPYAATSFLSVALNRVLRTAMTGVSRERPELAAAALPPGPSGTGGSFSSSRILMASASEYASVLSSSVGINGSYSAQ